MAKSKKNRQADFQKVKLKVGKKLKKADNVTNTSFKTRKVQISQHLKTGQESAPSTKKRQNISELFTQCRHYSSSTRQDAISGLKELITAYPDLLNVHLSDILEKTAELLTDKDPKVRQGAVRVLKSCLPKISEKVISPFFPLLCAHLCCAMTHIVDEIQMDSLTVLDILLEQYPKLLISVSNQVLSNFLEQISRQKGHGDGKRSLATNPNSQTSSQKWRKSVFTRLQKFLSAMLKSQGDGTQDSCDTSEAGAEMTFTSAQVKQLFPVHIKHQWENPGFTLGSEAMADSPGSSGPIGDRLCDFAGTLMPLILECWVEAAPSQGQSLDTGRQLMPDNAGAMYSVLQVTQALLEALDVHHTGEDTKWPRAKYMKEFSKHFLAHFPYDVHVAQGKTGKKEQHEQVSSDTLNLTICDIMSRFLPRPSPTAPEPLPAWLPVIVEYVGNFLRGRYNRGTVARGCHITVKVVSRLIHARIDKGSLQGILSAMFQRFRGGQRLSQEKLTYLQFLARILLEGSDDSVNSADLQQKFLCSLPELLPLAVGENRQMAALVVSVMKQAACQQHLTFLQQDIASVQHWFDPADGIILKLAARERLGLLSLLYSLPEISPGLMTTLSLLAQHEGLTESQAAFLIQSMQHRYARSGEEPETATGHVTFLCQLVLGLGACIRQSGVEGDLSLADGRYWIDPATDVNLTCSRLKFIVQMVYDVVSQCRNPEDIASIMYRVITTFMKVTKQIPVQAAYGICRFARLLPASPAPHELSELSVAAFIFTLTLDTECDPHLEEILPGLQEAACHLILTLPNGLDVFTRQVQGTYKDCPLGLFGKLTFSVQLLLDCACEKTLLQTSGQLKSLLTWLMSRLKQLQQSAEVPDASALDISRQLAEMEYRLSTPPWS